MSDFNFFSDNKYIILPTKSWPKVFLSITKKDRKNSFKLYQPFSFKAKLLKTIAFYFPYFNIVKKDESAFVKHLDNRFNKSFTSSLYFATDKNKVIIQLQENSNIFGYLKIGVTNKGNEKIKHEINAINILHNINPIKLIDQGVFEGYEYFITEELKGNIGFLSEEKIKYVLKRLERETAFPFQKHPRVLQIKKGLERIQIEKYLQIFSSIVISEKLKLVYEHGDFTPWNIADNDNNIKMFDLEYFTEDGLEHFDLIKYFYQIEILLNKSPASNLIEVILSKLDCHYNKELFTLFLLKEIVIKKDEGLSINKENELLNIILVR
ncbi:hypothetical protein OAJ65_01700 [Flavobacteriales bacterium]|nr:hypothetical protein [Flavobacteriales bacterium]